MIRWKILVAVVLCVCSTALASAAAALASGSPGPAWSLQSINQPTSFSEADDAACGGCDLYILELTNVGERTSNGQITVTDHLPPGIVTAKTPATNGVEPLTPWSCNEGAGNTVVTCTTNSSVPAFTPANSIDIPLLVTTSSGTLTNIAEVSGGEASTVTTTSSSEAGLSRQPFGVLQDSFSSMFLGVAGESDGQASDHPGAVTTSFVLPSVDNRTEGLAWYPVGNLAQAVVDLPAGFIGDALATPTCTLTAVDNFNVTPEACPRAARVGTLTLTIPGGASGKLTIFNVTPERGHAAEFAVYYPPLQRAVILYGDLVGQGAGAHVRITSAPTTIFVAVLGVWSTFFGNPSAVDATGDALMPLATMPADCGRGSFTTMIHVDSWQQPGRFLPDGQPDLADPNWKGAEAVAPPVTGCEALQFHPSLAFGPEPGHAQADEPAGYEAKLDVPQNEAPHGLGTPPVKRTVVTLPAGVSISPSAANGLAACQETGGEGIELESNQAGHCPDASKVGSATVVTPLLKEPLEGSVYVAQPACSPCSEAQAETGQAFALYLEVGSETYGVHIKLKGTVEVGGNGQHSREVGLAPGQVRTTFAETPQQPFSDLKLDFHGGPRAPLANPQSCGSYASSAELESWAHTPAPGEAHGTPNVTATPSFAIDGNCGNGFAPGLVAGTVNPQAGAFSPFTLTLSRHDGEQDLAGLSVSMPPGLLGKIAGLQQCPAGPAAEGTCGTVTPGSRVGTATAAAGSGSLPYWQSGGVYLTGPYEGAPFGLSVVVPAKAGPYDLGNIVVRAAIQIDPHTAQVTVKSDPLPQMVDGVPLRVQTINVTVGDSTSFTLNPTGCEPSQVIATVASVQGATASVASRFQVANCAALPFKPRLAAATAGKTSRANGASLKVKIAAKPGEANVGKVDVQLPKALPSRLSTLRQACSQAQFESNPAGCPVGSDVATATVHTPLLNAPLSGPAYFVSHGGAAFPDLDLVLQGEGVTIDLVGHTDIKKGITYSRFETVPDAPFSSFELNAPQGPDSILAANVNLCKTTLQMPTTLVAQNGVQLKQSTKIQVSGCTKKKAKHKRKAKAPKQGHKHKRRGG